MSAPIPLETLESVLLLYDAAALHRPAVDREKEILQSAIYYARRCQILEGLIPKPRSDLREITSDATTIRVQAPLPEDPYPQDPNEVL